ncbi:MAG: hypothetical protein ACN6PN_07280, partial [Sphingobacterium sp.]
LDSANSNKTSQYPCGKYRKFIPKPFSVFPHFLDLLIFLLSLIQRYCRIFGKTPPPGGGILSATHI